MRKTVIRLIPALFCLLLLWGCAADGPDNAGGSDNPEPQQPSKLDSIPFEENQQYAVAYIGYQQTDDLAGYAVEYLDNPAVPTYYISDGDFYLIIPRYAGTSLSLFANDIETGESRLLAEDPDCGPFLVQCNASDIFADATIRLTCEDGTAEFSPFISLEDGSLDIGTYGLDLTESADDSGQ